MGDSDWVQALQCVGGAPCVLHEIANTPCSGEGRLLVRCVVRRRNVKNVCKAVQLAVKCARGRVRELDGSHKVGAYINPVLYGSSGASWEWRAQSTAGLADPPDTAV